MSYVRPPPPDSVAPPTMGVQSYQYNQYHPPNSGYQSQLPPPPPHQRSISSFETPSDWHNPHKRRSHHDAPRNHRDGPQHGARSSFPPHYPQQTGHDKGQKSKMVVTRFPRPGGQHSGSHQDYNQAPPPPPPPPPPSSLPPPPPPAATSHLQTTWSRPRPAPPSNYPAPPPPSGNTHAHVPHHQSLRPPPPPTSLSSYHGGYGQRQQPHDPHDQQSLPRPPPTAAGQLASPYYPAPFPDPDTRSWNAPPQPPRIHSQSVYPSPVPAPAYQPPSASITPAQSIANIPPSRAISRLSAAPKDRNDPTFYDGWDEEEFEFGAALWPAPGAADVDDKFSLGQFIWHPPVRVARAVSPNVDDEVPLAASQRSDPYQPAIASKYFENEDAEGHEYVYNFQRIRYVDAWEERKDDPLFRVFSKDALHKDVIPADEVFQQVLTRAEEGDQRQAEGEILQALDDLLEKYLGVKAKGKSINAESILASLGVSGTAKPVFSTPFPAYNPLPDSIPKERMTENIFMRSSSTLHAFERPIPTPSPSLRRSTPQNSLATSSSASAAVGAQNLQPRIPYNPHAPLRSHKPPTRPNDPYRSGPLPPSSITELPPPPAYARHNHVHSFPGSQQPAAMYKPSHYSDHHERGALGQPLTSTSSWDSWRNDPWNAHAGATREDTAQGAPTTPAGSDFGDFNSNSVSSSGRQQFPADLSESKKRKIDQTNEINRKRNKIQTQGDTAYQRRW